MYQVEFASKKYSVRENCKGDNHGNLINEIKISKMLAHGTCKMEFVFVAVEPDVSISEKNLYV